jgi:predicted nucleic acid-binding Zn ribbon protein
LRGRERSGEPEGLGEVLDRLLRGRPWGRGVALGELGRRWTAVVGERLAEECSPVRLEEGVLVVRASSAAWGSQLRFLSREIRDRANAVLGERPIREVKVVLGEPTDAARGGPGRRRA